MPHFTYCPQGLQLCFLEALFQLRVTILLNINCAIILHEKASCCIYGNSQCAQYCDNIPWSILPLPFLFSFISSDENVILKLHHGGIYAKNVIMLIVIPNRSLLPHQFSLAWKVEKSAHPLMPSHLKRFVFRSHSHASMLQYESRKTFPTWYPWEMLTIFSYIIIVI